MEVSGFPESVGELTETLRQGGYLADRGLATSLFVALSLNRPILLEGEVYICTYEVPGGGRAHREQIARELTAIYRPRCNDQQNDQAWKDQWIGETTSSSPWLARDPARPEASPGTAPRRRP